MLRKRTLWQRARRSEFQIYFKSILPPNGIDTGTISRHCIEEKHGRDGPGYLREDRDTLYTQKVGGPNPSPPRINSQERRFMMGNKDVKKDKKKPKKTATKKPGAK
jgi:hypothetical protein